MLKPYGASRPAQGHGERPSRTGPGQPSTATPSRTDPANRSASSTTAARSASDSPDPRPRQPVEERIDHPNTRDEFRRCEALPSVVAALSAARSGGTPSFLAELADCSRPLSATEGSKNPRFFRGFLHFGSRWNARCLLKWLQNPLPDRSA